MEYYSTIKKEGTTDTCNNTSKSEKSYVKQKKPDTREYIQYNPKTQEFQ